MLGSRCIWVDCSTAYISRGAVRVNNLKCHHLQFLPEPQKMWREKAFWVLLLLWAKHCPKVNSPVGNLCMWWSLAGFLQEVRIQVFDRNTSTAAKKCWVLLKRVELLQSAIKCLDKLRFHHNSNRTTMYLVLCRKREIKFLFMQHYYSIFPVQQVHLDCKKLLQLQATVQGFP